MTSKLRLDHCVIAVSNWERARVFYRAALGVEIRELPYGRRAFRFANAQLNVHGPGATPHPAAARPERPGNSDLCFEWPGPITEAIAHLEHHGIAIIEGPVERCGACGNGQSIYFHDPDGTLLELIAYPSTQTTATAR